ncbi:PREDICTED: putative nuclease HARBI1 [Cyphomyrmex costatus]|uniref:putative nuclease HARBI1 n=1 Tax=Cyphomyrmex costatus TaxID=456900 RepID=UPI0008523ABD|nr:PREDICTED: putative nuclease HARBI1 [Cyphomyrmex costatus]
MIQVCWHTAGILLAFCYLGCYDPVQELIDSSSSDKSEDEELKILERYKNPRRHVKRIENYVEEIIPGLTKEEFKAHFRSICERFNFGRSTALCITRRVVRALVQLAPVVIKWPTGERLNEVWTGFESTSGFPKVIGAIDGTHINIPAPRGNPESYVNRKGHHSIQLQAICDHKGLFTHCYVGHVGSVHDQRVFRQSEGQSYLGDITKFPQDSHLVGNLAYKLHENLLTPYRDNGHLTRRQQNYNFCHASSRVVIERAFGLLKGRFRSLLAILAMARTDLIPMHILACCVLHNICLMKGDEFNFKINENVEIIIDVAGNDENVPHIANAATAKRDMICQTLKIRHV